MAYFNNRSPLGRYRQAIRDGADPIPWQTECEHRGDVHSYPRTASTVFAGQFRDQNEDMKWMDAWELMRNHPERPPYFDVDEAYAGFHRKR